jgi:CHASE3 domain sensor protein
MKAIIDQIKSNVSSKSIEQIEDMLQQMAKTKRADMDDAAKVVRVALLDIVEEKRGEEYVDKFMNLLDEIEAAH